MDEHKKGGTLAVLGVFATIIASVIAVITFMTGKSSLPELLNKNQAIASSGESSSSLNNLDYDWVFIKEVTLISTNQKKHTARISVNVQYYLYSEQAALLEVNGNYMNEDSWTSFDSGSTTGIESGYGEEIFEFDVDVPYWDDFSLRAYMQPIKHDDTWTPLAKTEPHAIDLNSNFF